MCFRMNFCHRLPFERSSLTHWRQRLGEEQLVALIQKSLSVAHKTGALATRDLETDGPRPSSLKTISRDYASPPTTSTEAAFG